MVTIFDITELSPPFAGKIHGGKKDLERLVVGGVAAGVGQKTGFGPPYRDASWYFKGCGGSSPF
jgi:hypothetical protein